MKAKDDTHDCSERVYAARLGPMECPRRGVVFREGKWYCRQHDPEAVRARRATRDAGFRAREDRNERLARQAKDILRRLGVRGRVYYNALGRGIGGNTEHIVISFEDAEMLVAAITALRKQGTYSVEGDDWCGCGHSGVWDDTVESGHAGYCREARAVLARLGRT